MNFLAQLFICTFTFLCFNSIQSATAQRDPKEEEIEKNCITKFKITSDQLSKLHGRDFDAITVDQAVMCYARCFFSQAEIVDQTGILNAKVIEAEAPDEIKKEMPGLVEKCNKLTGVDSCETAFRQTKCLVAEMKIVEKIYADKMIKEQEEMMKVVLEAAQQTTTTITET